MVTVGRRQEKKRKKKKLVVTFLKDSILWLLEINKWENTVVSLLLSEAEYKEWYFIFTNKKPNVFCCYKWHQIFFFSPSCPWLSWQNNRTEFNLCISTAVNSFMNVIVFESSLIVEFSHLPFCLMITRVRLFSLLK